ncbi:MAG: tryptophan--tRNA ligase [Balneola sp.]|jgi:tryptophanyl-tRNA synthetase|nr:tryptophan--tRNA ligase [Balneola sp.]MBE79614.1 tryptophan--tRNA ligase [Balneola sp.]HBX66599.1 tryptophan--tRNA ligase [Balneolaceae bacterium]|tara:strand:- start:68332 stop:69324 length:993 start_codon:yes stop_codon:yes gene_type:complete
MSDTKTILSGIQPSGKLHIGNYFGAIRQHIQMQEKGEAFYFIANYHSLTSLNDGKQLKQNTLDVTLDYLALGLDPEKATFFAQSDVPQVTELAWILGTLAPVSMMEKGVSYKDKIAAGLNPNIGLFTYPILQAADILIYHSDVVPVGEDQKQNIEITRDLAGKFNHTFDGEYLKLPEEHIVKSVAIVPGTDGRKMSKSYKNTINIFAEGKALKKRVMSIDTDSTPLEDPKDPETDNVFALIKLFADKETQQEIAKKYKAGGYGYGHAKQELLGMIEEYFGEARERRKELAKDLDYVHDVLREGGKKARERAETVMQPIREVTGIVRHFNL